MSRERNIYSRATDEYRHLVKLKYSMTTNALPKSQFAFSFILKVQY